MEVLMEDGNTYEVDPAAVQTARKFVVGVDLGQAHDPTAVCVVERISSWWYTTPKAQRTEHLPTKYHVRHLERLKLETPYPAQIAHIRSLLKREPLVSQEPTVALDYTGVGRPVFDMFKAARVPRLLGINITSGLTPEPTAVGWSVPKVELVSNVQAMLHAGHLKIARELPEAGALLRELQDFRVNFTTAGNATFGAREGMHDDLVLALAIAVFAVNHSKEIRVEPLWG